MELWELVVAHCNGGSEANCGTELGIKKQGECCKIEEVQLFYHRAKQSHDTQFYWPAW